MLDLSEPMIVIIWALLFIGALIISQVDTKAIQGFEKQISEQSLSSGLYYSTQAMPCLSRSILSVDETKRFVLDRAVLDSVLGDFGRIPCASYRDIKYWVGVFDLDRPDGQWTFKNFQPLEADAFVPRYGQLVVIDDGGKMHRAFVGVYVEMPEKTINMSLWMFCNTTAANESLDFKQIYNRIPFTDGGRGIEDAYWYPTNKCDSKNCVKGPGQMLPTCQPSWYTYSKNVGDPCSLNAECKSLSCSGGACQAGSAPTLLMEGQPCRVSAECDTGLVCAYDLRCRTTLNSGMNIAKFTLA